MSWSSAGSAESELLARSHGYLAVARDGLAGVVETPLFPPDGDEPDFLILRVGGRVSPSFPVVPVALVREVEPEQELVFLGPTRGELAGFPEHLPLAI